MNTRVSKKLSEWTVISEEKLREEIFKLTGKNASDSEIEYARVLFAKVLDTPGGIKIQTLHSFCQDILTRFPLEAQIAPYFSVIDDRMAKEALERLAALPEEKVTEETKGITEALKVVLLETDEEKLAGYYKRIEEFYTVNVGRGLEYMNGEYLIRGV